MIKVNSGKTIQALAKNTFQNNRMRNLFAVIAIMLTTVMFTGMFATINSMIKSVEESTMRQTGGNAHGCFKSISEEQYEHLKMHKSIKEISYSVVLAVADNEELGTRQTEIRYANDELEAQMMFAFPTTGRMPQQYNEIAMDTLVLERLGIPADLGETVTLSYSLAGKRYHEKFVLTGFWKGDISAFASQVWVCREYVEEQLRTYIPSDGYDFTGKINADVKFYNSWFLESKMRNVLEDCGYSEDEILYGVNWAYMGGRDLLNIKTVLGTTFIIAMIIACGYLIISNIFYIGITRDIQYYGLLKIIGTTRKQIRQLVRRQALWLCIPGIIIGILLGALFGKVIVPILMTITSADTVKVCMHPLVFLLAAVFSVITVLVSCIRPSSLAAKVSPMEAIRTVDGVVELGREFKRSRGIHLGWMAWGNVLRNKKKVWLVIISLSLGLIILNIAYSLSNSFDMDKYLKDVIGNDFAIADTAYFSTYQEYESQNTISGRFLKELEGLEGIESLSNIYFYESAVAVDDKMSGILALLEGDSNIDSAELSDIRNEIDTGTIMRHIYGLDYDVWDQLIVRKGKIDKEKLMTGNYVVVGSYDAESGICGYDIGDIVNVESEDGSINGYEVLAVADIPYYISIRHYHTVQSDFYLPGDVFLSNVASKAPMLTVVDVSSMAEQETEIFLRKYCDSNSDNMQYQSKDTLAKEYEGTRKAFRLTGMILSALLAVIGITNFINTIITSILERRREQAVLQSIGMTNQQMIRMQIYEGMVYMIFTLFLTLTIGSLVGGVGLGIMMSNSYFSIHFTVVPTLVCMPILLLITVSVPYFTQRSICRKSVVERLR